MLAGCTSELNEVCSASNRAADAPPGDTYADELAGKSESGEGEPGDVVPSKMTCCWSELGLADWGPLEFSDEFG